METALVMTQKQKLNALLELCREDFNNYKPSMHVLYYFWEQGSEDLDTTATNFKDSMRRFLDKINLNPIPDMDFAETDPGPLYFLDLTRITDCWAVLEYKLLMADAEIRMQTIMKNFSQEVMKEIEDIDE